MRSSTGSAVRGSGSPMTQTRSELPLDRNQPASFVRSSSALGASMHKFVSIWFVLSACTTEPVSEAPRAFTEARALTAGPPRSVGEDCTTSGSDGCTTGRCLKIEGGIPGRHICTTSCTPDGLRPCPATWPCLQVLPNEGGFYCVPPARWVAKAVALEPAVLRVPPVYPPFPPPALTDGGRP